MRRRVALAMAVLTALVLAPVASVRADLPVPVVLIPGWHGDPASFDHMIPVLQRAGLSVLDFDPARPGPQAMAYAPTADGQHIPDVATRVVRPAIEAALARAGYPAGSAVDVVGYSMGGLVARYLIEKAGPTVGPVQLPGSSPRIDVRIDVTEKDPWARQVVATAATAATSSGSRSTESRAIPAEPPMPDGVPLPEEIVLNAEEARVVYLAVVAALDLLGPGEAQDLCLNAQRILVVKYLPDLPELGEE